eukprot:CAMPEP_0194272764 /NCGR_PEP_ID=MMETSP0169-20130528/6242_1 /TAXON_ID=218684 /ORGANISM="Corethron pennatum, Strain L29A3" /LENGTH=137 /DNA_ID=CAMNT_0039015505 /DNA_START=180 /DNA_END=590 /DNA_ORIENTATION=-
MGKEYSDDYDDDEYYESDDDYYSDDYSDSDDEEEWEEEDGVTSRLHFPNPRDKCVAPNRHNKIQKNKMKRVGVVEGCVASNYPRTIYGEDEWAVFQNAYNELHPKNAGEVGKNGFLIEYEVQNHPVRGRTIVTKEDI